MKRKIIIIIWCHPIACILALVCHPMAASIVYVCYYTSMYLATSIYLMFAVTIDELMLG